MIDQTKNVHKLCFQAILVNFIRHSLFTKILMPLANPGE